MNPLRAAYNWGQVAFRAVPYGTISVTLGPLTNRKASQWAMKRWCVGAANGLGIQRTLVNGQLLENDRQCVYIANHLSLLDILVLGSYLRDDYRWLSKEAIFKVPFLGWHLKSAGHVPVFRGERRHLNKDLPQRLRTVIAEGASLLFFPEGTRSRDGLLQPFKLGAFYAAVDEQLPIVPLVIRGTDGLMQKGARDLAIDHDRECSVTVLPQIETIAPQSSSDDDRRRAAIELCAQSVRAVASELGEAVPGVVTDDKEVVFAEERPAA